MNMKIQSRTKFLVKQALIIFAAAGLEGVVSGQHKMN
jgi:hypothetical protein